MSESPNVALRAERQTYTAADHEAVYHAYAIMEKPSVRKAADICGISHRTAELWCAQENWVERRASEQLERVAAIRRRIETILMDNATAVTQRAVDLAMQDDDRATAARMTVHVMGLIGYSPVSKSASVVQHLSSPESGGTRGGGDDARSLGEIVDAFNARLAALGAPTPPQDIKNEDERKMTGGVPLETVPTVSNSSSYRSGGPETDEDFFEVETAPRPDGGEGADGEEGAVIEASFREA